jgi:hypothetical protein
LRAAGHHVAVLTYRDPPWQRRTEEQLLGWGVAYDALHFAATLEDKGRLCRELALDVFFDDQDECIVPVDATTLVLKVRNGGNFDFTGRCWLSTSRLTRLL